MRFRTYALTLMAVGGAGLALTTFADTQLPEFLRSSGTQAPQTWGGWVAVAFAWVVGVATTACGGALVAWHAVALMRLRRARGRLGRVPRK